MNLTQCEHGHYYDKDKFDSCPHCKGGVGGTDKTTNLTGPGGVTDYFEGDGGNVTVPIKSGGIDSWTAEDTGWGGADVTQPANNGWAVKETAPETWADPQPSKGLMAGPDGFSDRVISGAETVPLSRVPGDGSIGKYEGQIKGHSVPDGLGGKGLEKVLKEIGETTVTPTDDSKTVSYYNNVMDKGGIDPVVGWLVCIKGEDFGSSFVLKSGKNFIGRDSKMDVALTKDRSVSRQCHAILLYDPKSRMFLVQPGTSRELFYLNDRVVLGVEAVQSNDILSVGNTNLMFIPCCGPNFCWEDHIEKMNEETDRNR